MPDAATLIRDLARVRERGPLVQNITNFVVMNNTANALLAIGASPVMAHAPEETADMLAFAGALVINIGTLDAHWVNCYTQAVKAAKKRGVPWVLDPVGVGATPYRTKTAMALLEEGRPAVVRGNASEILALAGAGGAVKGVDSTDGADAALRPAVELAKRYSCVVSVSGETDHITDGRTVVSVANGHPLMPRVTGLGCTASALTGAFMAVNPNFLEAAAHAMGVMGIAGQLAMASSSGPGTLQLHFIDALYELSPDTVGELLQMSTHEVA